MRRRTAFLTIIVQYWLIPFVDLWTLGDPWDPFNPVGPGVSHWDTPFRMGMGQEYADTAAELVKLRREAKLNGNFFVEPEVTRNLNAIDMEVS